MAPRWTERELNTLSQNLVDGFPVPNMIELIPSREIGGIKQKAQDFGFGVITSKVDRITRFYANIRTRVRGANVSTEVDEVSDIINVIEVAQPPQAVPNHGIAHTEPSGEIIPYNGLSANALAIQMLREKNLSVNPDIIHTLSVHILQGGNS